MCLGCAVLGSKTSVSYEKEIAKEGSQYYSAKSYDAKNYGE